MIMQRNFRSITSGFKKRVAVIAAGLVVASVLGFSVLTPAGTGVASANSGALVIDDFGCRLLDGYGRIVYASSSHAVIAQGANGNRVLKCSVKGVANYTGKAAHFDQESTGYWCNAMGAVATNWFNKVSKSGNSTLTCFVQ